MIETMRAKVTLPGGFRCAPEGHTVVTFPCGTIIEGQPARWAVDMQAAIWLPAYDTKVTAPDEAKAEAPKRRGRPRKAKT